MFFFPLSICFSFFRFVVLLCQLHAMYVFKVTCFCSIRIQTHAQFERVNERVCEWVYVTVYIRRRRRSTDRPTDRERLAYLNFSTVVVRFKCILNNLLCFFLFNKNAPNSLGDGRQRKSTNEMNSFPLWCWMLWKELLDTQAHRATDIKKERATCMRDDRDRAKRWTSRVHNGLSAVAVVVAIGRQNDGYFCCCCHFFFSLSLVRIWSVFMYCCSFGCQHESCFLLHDSWIQFDSI